ncbi:hypothetical protein EDEG_00088 [Edhazardia aedis USNM 41457]|uniref:Uncharacterized protein n=1 Tax=Edhazardia aedis (strain USNM 41457) TaxID=1003232 RepID=J9DB30_EDHAE|nr:hypothetical protein EDEG_00088 [Edhazardia aedis USNM 41457]|eukprot:EJW04971.1 hypothetical protein EDEG_00088 [Edhazardia aedis USNM 41457]
MAHNWKYLGEVTKINRPKDSLLDNDISFEQVNSIISYSKDIENEFKKIVDDSLSEKRFDNFILNLKKEENNIFSDTAECESDPKSDDELINNDGMTKDEMVSLFWEIDNELNSICDFSGSCLFGVEKVTEIPKSVIKNDNKKDENTTDNIFSKDTPGKPVKKRKNATKLVKQLKKTKNVKVLY